MGCHTWFYKKVDRTFKKATKLAIEKCRTDIQNCYKWIEEIKTGEDNGLTIEELKYSILYKLRCLIWINKGIMKKGIWELQPESLSVYYNSNFYVEEGTHDLFRIGGYPEDILYSYGETIDFIVKNQILIKEQNLQLLQDWWEKYPDGIIKFG